ncbi:MAG: guanylate kinase [Culicoidibacterales bacterium]
MKRRGILFVVSGPSGVGKGTVRAALFEREGVNLSYSVSMTTRTPREGEVDGVDYFFADRDQFETMIGQDGFIESAEFCGNYYGTPKAYVEKQLEAGKDVVLEIEVQGAFQVKKAMSEAVFIFIAPPSLNELQSRLNGRGTEAPDVVLQRLQTAVKEMMLMSEYDYVVTNDEVNAAVERILAIIEAEHLSVKRVAANIREELLSDSIKF